MKVKTLVLTGYGINCEKETAECFKRAGSDSKILHLNQLLRRPDYLQNFQLLAIPGGFSFGDHLASGKIFANKLKFFLIEELSDFIRSGKGIIGICNGFQVLVKSGILPGWDHFSHREVTITHNEQGRFENRWVQLKINHQNKSFWLHSRREAGVVPSLRSSLELPVRHGEGRFVVRREEKLKELLDGNLVALSYQNDRGQATLEYPNNPNGSVEGIAGITNIQGNVLGLMPHPEAYMIQEQAPRFKVDGERPVSGDGLGMSFFYGGVQAMERLFHLDGSPS